MKKKQIRRAHVKDNTPRRGGETTPAGSNLQQVIDEARGWGRGNRTRPVSSVTASQAFGTALQGLAGSHRLPNQDGEY